QGFRVGDDLSDNVCETRCTPGRYTVVFRGQDLDQSQIHLIYDKQGILPLVTFAFKGDAQKRFANYTADNIANYLTIILDGKVIESAVIQSEITDRFNIRLPTPHATALIAQLVSGELPLMMTLMNVEQATPTTK